MSVYWDILTACRALLSADPAFAGVGVKIRKRPYFDRDHGDTFPMAVLAPLGEAVADVAFEEVVFLDHPVVLAVMQGQGATLASEAALQAQMAYREAARQALYRTSLPGTPVMDADYNAAPNFDLEGLDHLCDVSLQLFTFRTKETRSGS
jgi:hypothetical protein